MQILFYVEPLVERENPTWKSGWISHFVNRFYSTLVNENQAAELACIVPTALETTARNVLPDSFIATIDQSELIPYFGNSALEIATGWYKDGLGEAALKEMAELIHAKLGDFQPEICITFSPAPFLQQAFPNAKVLHFELGFISRSPFPETVYFDPLGMFEAGVLTRFSQEIKTYSPVETELNLLEQIRKDFCSLGDDSNPLHEFIAMPLKRFESAILLPLQFSNFYAYDAHAQFKDQYDLLIHTLASTPAHIAVVVCEHPEHPVLKADTIEYLRQRYSNFIWHPIFRVVYGASHYLMPYVQGVVTVSSSVGLQALLWKKKLAVLGHSHLNIACDTDNIIELCDLIFDKDWSTWKDSLLIWLLTRYHLPLDLVCSSGRFSRFLLEISSKDFSHISNAASSSGINLPLLVQYYQQICEERPASAYGNNAMADSNNFFSSLYVASENFPYDEKSCLRKFISWQSTSEVTMEFLLENANSIPIQLRFDPMSQSGNLILNALWITDARGHVIWGGSEHGDTLGRLRKIRTIPLHGRNRLLLQCESNDPQIELSITPTLLATANYPLTVHVTLSKADQEIVNQANADRDTQIADLSRANADRDTQIADLSRAIVDRDTQIVDLSQTIADKDAFISKFLRSNSWRLAVAFRVARRVFVTKPLNFIDNSMNPQSIWHKLPIDNKRKQSFKSFIFNKLSFVFNKTEAYRNWARSNSLDLVSASRIHTAKSSVNFDKDVKFVPITNDVALKNKSVKIICFYLPQFHAIAENNEWWGDGFTEWVNVKPAQPQFVGHYQPHVPGELGYYDLLNPATQHRQIELAKLYGIEGFCFYFYWFAGKRLLEAPIENYLNNNNLDLPFCLCWANENWSRRWDGLDSEILIAQEYSVEDDLAFIAYVARYMKDPRYIRIDGKPLLLVYRPSLLPSAKDTSKRWRNWCNENGIGEIYIAYTQSFEAVDPAKYGFDAAVEFPPNNSAPPNITDSIDNENPNFQGMVYDWRVFVERSKHYKKPSYKLFRGVCPSWDNTARRKNKGTIFLNSTPEGYQEWLFNALNETCERVENVDERLVFVNAWNEWAEGAHLEPDMRYGYAHLEATKMALVRNERFQAQLSPELGVMAVIIHAFYEDVLCEILEYLKLIKGVPFKLYITTTHEKLEIIQSVLDTYKFDCQVSAFENRGRDILPFMKVIHSVIDNGHQFFLKLHTKKSLHREDGAAWRKEILDKLIGHQAIKHALNVFSNNKSIGIIGPEGHLVAMNYFWGSNANKVVNLSNRLGVSADKLSELNFVAGSMFFARTNAIIPLLNLAINDNDFELELGQVDGTMAHAIERLFSVSAYSAGLSTTSDGQKSTQEYRYASQTAL